MESKRYLVVTTSFVQFDAGRKWSKDRLFRIGRIDEKGLEYGDSIYLSLEEAKQMFADLKQVIIEVEKKS